MTKYTEDEINEFEKDPAFLKLKEQYVVDDREYYARDMGYTNEPRTKTPELDKADATMRDKVKAAIDFDFVRTQRKEEATRTENIAHSKEQMNIANEKERLAKLNVINQEIPKLLGSFFEKHRNVEEKSTLRKILQFKTSEDKNLEAYNQLIASYNHIKPNEDSYNKNIREFEATLIKCFLDKSASVEVKHLCKNIENQLVTVGFLKIPNIPAPLNNKTYTNEDKAMHQNKEYQENMKERHTPPKDRGRNLL